MTQGKACPVGDPPRRERESGTNRKRLPFNPTVVSHPAPLKYQLAQHPTMGRGEASAATPSQGLGDEGGAVVFLQRTWKAGATWSMAGTAGGWRKCPETVEWNSSTMRTSRSSLLPPSSKEKGLGRGGERGPPLLPNALPPGGVEKRRSSTCRLRATGRSCWTPLSRPSW